MIIYPNTWFLITPRKQFSLLFSCYLYSPHSLLLNYVVLFLRTSKAKNISIGFGWNTYTLSPWWVRTFALTPRRKLWLSAWALGHHDCFKLRKNLDHTGRYYSMWKSGLCIVSCHEGNQHNYALSPWPWSAKQIDLVFDWLTMSSSEQSMFLACALWLLYWINTLLHFVPCKSCLFFSQLKSISVTNCIYSIKVNSVNCVLRQRINHLSHWCQLDNFYDPTFFCF